jgi:hypothetical protein
MLFTSLAVALVAALPSQSGGQATASAGLNTGRGDLMLLKMVDPDGRPSRLTVRVDNVKLKVSKQSPRKFGDPPEPWLFEYLVSTYAFSPRQAGQQDLRHRVYSQLRNATNDPAVSIARTLLRLFDFNYWQLDLDHDPTFSNGVIDIYLSFGGTPGGEQRLDVDYQRKPKERVNTIYIYDLASFTDPIEKLREVAHEYGHATLPPIGGFQRPEDWANGYLGERVYLRWIRNEMAKGRFFVDDAMGANQPSLDEYVATKVTPLVDQATKLGPTSKWWGVGPEAMDGFMGLALAIDQFVGPRAMARSLVLTDPSKAKDYAKSAADAIQEQPSWRVTTDEANIGRTLWLPTGDILTEGATVMETSGFWRKLKIDAKNYVIRPVKRPGGTGVR